LITQQRRTTEVVKSSIVGSYSKLRLREPDITASALFSATMGSQVQHGDSAVFLNNNWKSRQVQRQQQQQQRKTAGQFFILFLSVSLSATHGNLLHFEIWASQLCTSS
jgi:hypothetical protein